MFKKTTGAQAPRRKGLFRMPGVPARLKRRLRWTAILILLFLILVCGSCVALGAAAGRAKAAPQEPGLDVMLVIDNSNSMFDKAGIGSDPLLRRIEAARLFIHYLGVDISSVTHRLGVIFFGGSAQEVLPPTQLAEAERRTEIDSLIADPQRMTWTDPVEALALARAALMRDQSAARQRVVVLLTDGKPEWDSTPTQAERDRVLDELRTASDAYAAEEIRLFIILLENAATDADSEIAEHYVPLWREMTEVAGGRYYAVREADELIGIYHDILLSLSNMASAGTVVDVEVDDQSRTEDIVVEPDLARVTFVVRATHPTTPAGPTGASGPSIAVELYHPDGRILEASEPGVRHASYGSTAIWAVDHPDAGTWSVAISGQGHVTVWKDYMPEPATPTPRPTPIPTATPAPQPTSTPLPTPTSTPTPHAIVADWPEVALAGEAIALSASFQPPFAAPPEVSAEWEAPDGSRRILRLLDDGRLGDAEEADGIYTAVITPEQTGPAHVRLRASSGDGVVSTWEGRIQIVAHPALALVEPTPREIWRTNREVGVQVQWRVGDSPCSWPGEANATLLGPGGVLETAEGSVGSPITLNSPSSRGTYTVTVSAQGESAEGLPFEDTVSTTVRVRRPFPIWVPLVGVLGGGGTGGGIYAVGKLRRRPLLTGKLRWLDAPAAHAGPGILDLSGLGKAAVVLGDAEPRLPLPPQTPPWARLRVLPDGSGIVMEALNSKEVKVNDVPLAGSRTLQDRDRITVDGVRLRYERL